MGALDHANADISVAITGVAGPAGGSPEKPVGLVHFSVARQGAPTIQDVQKFGNLSRADIRSKATAHALSMVLAQLVREP